MQGQTETELLFQSQEWEDEEVTVLLLGRQNSMCIYAANGFWILEIRPGIKVLLGS